MSAWDPDNPPKPQEEMAVEQRHLTFLQVADQQFISRSRLERLPSGAYHPELETDIDVMTGNMAVRIRALMLTEPAGPEVTESKTEAFRFTSPDRPWWIPRFLWRRIGWTERTVYRTVALTARPHYKYPEASIAVPDLGQVRRGVTLDVFTVDGDWSKT